LLLEFQNVFLQWKKDDSLTTEFYTDDHGATICVYCHTKSQDFIAESNDIEDGAADARVGGRLKISRVIQTVKKIKIAKAGTDFESDVFELLNLYQFCIKLVMKSAFNILGMTSSKLHHV
jgi:hypothetical protein